MRELPHYLSILYISHFKIYQNMGSCAIVETTGFAKNGVKGFKNEGLLANIFKKTQKRIILRYNDYAG